MCCKCRSHYSYLFSLPLSESFPALQLEYACVMPFNPLVTDPYTERRTSLPLKVRRYILGQWALLLSLSLYLSLVLFNPSTYTISLLFPPSVSAFILKIFHYLRLRLSDSVSAPVSFSQSYTLTHTFPTPHLSVCHFRLTG